MIKNNNEDLYIKSVKMVEPVEMLNRKQDDLI